MVFAGCQGPKFVEMQGAGIGGAANGAYSAGRADTNSTARIIDRIEVGDNLYIVFSDLPTLVPPAEERVREDGTIRLLQNQTFQAAGKLRGDLEKEIHQRYVPNFYRTMTVSVTPKVSTQFYYVSGEVRTPNRQVWLARITVLKAIASANGFTDFARKTKVVLTRANGTKHTINCIKAQGEPRLDLEVYPGDNIYVPRKKPWQR